MRLVWPGFECQVRGGRLICRGNLKPFDISREYSVRIEYIVGFRPNAWVLGLPSPDETDKKIPHRFKDGSICLFYHSEWTPELPIARTILPWLLEWLAFYEGWLATGEWQGGGIHPEESAENCQAT